MEPDPHNQSTLGGWTDTDWAGCSGTRRSTACGLIVWSGVVLSSYAWTLTEEMGLSSPIAVRDGVSGRRCLEREYLWIQQKVKEGTFQVEIARTG